MIFSLLSTGLQILVCLVPPLAGFATHMNSIYLKGQRITTHLAVNRCCCYDIFSLSPISIIWEYSKHPGKTRKLWGFVPSVLNDDLTKREKASRNFSRTCQCTRDMASSKAYKSRSSSISLSRVLQQSHSCSAQ